jgi:hypothetical protein
MLMEALDLGSVWNRRLLASNLPRRSLYMMNTSSGGDARHHNVEVDTFRCMSESSNVCVVRR